MFLENRLSKKGQVFEKEQLRMIYYALSLIFVVIVIGGVFSVAIHKEIDFLKLEQHQIVYRIFSQECFGGSYFVDLEKFSSEALKNCIDLENSHLGVELTLSYEDNGNMNVVGVEANEKVSSQKVVCGLKSSGYDCYKTRKYVLVKNGDEFERGVLDILVIGKNG